MQERHPMQQPRGYLVRTAPVAEFAAVLSGYLEGTELGLACTAPTKTGKTSTLDYLGDRFAAAGSAVFLRSIVVNYREKNHPPKFFRRLRGEEDAEDPHLVHRGPKLALINHVRNECDKRNTPTVIFALDEAQNLTLQELDILKVLTEELIGFRLRPFMLLMGQPELSMLIEWLRECRRPDLVGRFMARQCRLRGLQKGDFHGFCRHIDSATWPVGCQTTYTQHFVPALWANGWRMANQAAPLWDAFARMAGHLQLEPTKLEVGSQYLANAVLEVLRLLQASSDLRDKHVLYERAVAASAFDQTTVLTVRDDAVLSPAKREKRKLAVNWLRASGH